MLMQDKTVKRTCLKMYNIPYLKKYSSIYYYFVTKDTRTAQRPQNNARRVELDLYCDHRHDCLEHVATR